MTSTLSGRMFAILFAMTFVSQAGSALALNYVVDPRSEFGTDVFRPLTHDWHKTDLFRAAVHEERIDAVILGSSRSWGLPTSTLEEAGYDHAFNWAIGSAKARDLLTAYRSLVAAQGPPELVVIGFEDWQLGDMHGTPLEVASPGAGKIAAALAKSLSWRYVRDSVKTIEYNVNGFPERVYAFDEDGNVRWERRENQMARGAFQLEPEVHALYNNGNEHYYDSVRRVPEAPGQIEALVREARADGAEVILLLTPMHPMGAAMLPADKYPARLAEARALAFAQCAEGARVFDLTDPVSYGTDMGGYVDGWHFTQAEGEKILRHVLAREGC